MQEIETRPGCIQATLTIVGDKWTALIVRDLCGSARTFGEIELSLKGISPRTLSQRLQKLEAEAIVSRECYCQHPPRYRYQLTAKGRELQDILRKMAEWGDKYTARTIA